MDDDTRTTKTGTNGSSEKTDDDDDANKNDEKKDIEMTTTTRVGQVDGAPLFGGGQGNTNSVAENASGARRAKTTRPSEKTRAIQI